MGIQSGTNVQAGANDYGQPMSYRNVGQPYDSDQQQWNNYGQSTWNTSGPSEDSTIKLALATLG